MAGITSRSAFLTNWRHSRKRDDGTKLVVKSVGLEMPDDFPVSPFNAVHAKLSPLRNHCPDAWPEWLGGWNAIAYRFKSCADDDARFTESIQRDGDGPGQPARYFQEKSLFDFFMAGLASIDSFSHALYAVGSILDPAAFPITTSKDLRKVSPEWTLKLFAKHEHIASDAITTALEGILKDSDYEEMDDFRNVLAHRIAPRRQFRLSAGSVSATDGASWQPVATKGGMRSLRLDVTTTSSKRNWLAGALATVVGETERFIEQNSSRLPA